MENYDEQLADGRLSCPQCGSCEIRRVPSAVHLGTRPETPATVSSKDGSEHRHAAILAAGQQLLSMIVANSEDVGKNFAEEARKIHYMEAPARSIRGEASSEECESLLDEGIAILQLPIVKKEDLN